MKTLFALTIIITYLLTATSAEAQNFHSPDRELVAKARATVVDSVFARLDAGEADELSEWLVDQIHTDASGNTREEQLAQFLSQFRMIVKDEPNNPFGKLDGYDLLQEAALPGTHRYFRLTYITYHTRSPLIWEFHFYVTPEEDLSMVLFNFSSHNPFDYMSTPDMYMQELY